MAQPGPQLAPMRLESSPALHDLFELRQKPSHYCNLCGVGLFQRDSLRTDHAAWITEIRAGIVTRVGTLIEEDRIRVEYRDEADERHVEETPLGRSRLDYLSEDRQEWWETRGAPPMDHLRTYAFHDACWKLLLEKIARTLGRSWNPQADQVAEHLFNYLYCLPSSEKGATYPAHDFEGATRYRYCPRDELSSWNFLLADPIDTDLAPDLGSNSPWFTKPSKIRMGSGGSANDCFSRLPEEVISLILVCLSSADIASLRLSSRFVAVVAFPSILPQSFWESRFALGREMCFVSRDVCAEKANWRRLYFEADDALRNIGLSGHLRNRRRIWRCLHHITEPLIPLLKQLEIPGTQLQSLDSLESLLSTEGYAMGRIVRGPWRDHKIDREMTAQKRTGGIRRIGLCRLLLDLPAERTTPVAIRVSFITYDCTRYVCGIRLLEQTGLGFYKEKGRIGLILETAEINLIIAPQEHMTGLHVATSSSGIVGISFLFQGTTERSYSAGMIHELAHEVGIAVLRPEGGRPAAGIAVGFDVCKFVSIQLLERGQVAGQTRPEPYPSELWHPEEPSEADKQFISDHVRTVASVQIPNLILNMEFGGPGGSLLAKLIRIVAYHDVFYQSITGFAFYYNDGTSKTFGSTDIDDVEQSAAIDGPGGERIASMRYELPEDLKNKLFVGKVRSLDLLTNRGRRIQLQRLPGSSADDASLHTCQTRSLELVTGIFAKVTLTTLTIDALGAYGVEQTSPGFGSTLATKRRLSADSNDHTFAINPSYLPAFGDYYVSKLDPTDGTIYYTGVLLEGVRNIWVSSGAPGKVRAANHISGLYVDFFDNSPPVYVGQWFKGIETLGLEAGDKIASLAFWQTPTKGFQRQMKGRIAMAGLEIDVAGDNPKKLEVFLEDKSNLSKNTFYESKLVWGFNHRNDFIRTVP